MLFKPNLSNAQLNNHPASHVIVKISTVCK